MTVSQDELTTIDIQKYLDSEPVEIKRIRESLISWINIEINVVKLKHLHRFMTGVEGDLTTH